MRLPNAIAMIALTVTSQACERRPTVPNSEGGLRYALAWRTSQVTASSRTAVDETSVYSLDANHVVFAVSKTDGSLRWKTQLTYSFNPGFFQGYGIAVVAGRIVVGDIDVFGLDPQTGAIAWRFAAPLPGERPGSGHLSTDGTTVFAGGKWGNLYGLDAASGTLKWTTHVVADSNFSVNDPVVLDGAVYVGLSIGSGNFGGGAAAVDARDGRLIWSTLTPTDPRTPSGSGGVGVTSSLVVVGTENGSIYCLDRQTGVLQRTLPATLFLQSGEEAANEKRYNVRASNDAIYVGTGSGLVVALSAADQHVLWKTNVGGSVFDMRLEGSRLYVSAMTGGGLAVLDTGDGHIAWVVTGLNLGPAPGDHYESFIQAPSLDATRAYIGGYLGIYAFEKR